MECIDTEIRYQDCVACILWTGGMLKIEILMAILFLKQCLKQSVIAKLVISKVIAKTETTKHKHKISQDWV